MVLEPKTESIICFIKILPKFSFYCLNVIELCEFKDLETGIENVSLIKSKLFLST